MGSGQDRRPSLLDVAGLTVDYSLGSELFGAGRLRAVEDVNLRLERGATLALVGESGSGKSTVGRAVAGIVAPTAGTVRLEGTPVSGPGAPGRSALARRVQILFQDPWGSLNPRMTAGQAVREAPLFHGLAGWAADPAGRTAAVFARVGLPADAAERYPHEFSGGQRQRLALARALAMEPELLVLDEPTSALDVSMAAQVINLLCGLQRELGLTYLLIGHDLAVVEKLADDVAVMYAGRVVESGPAARLLGAPAHPYTRMLVETARGHRSKLPPAEARPVAPAFGCPFAPRCPRREADCESAAPGMFEVAPGHSVRCVCRD